LKKSPFKIFLRKVYIFLGSLKLAVVVILSVAVIAAVGTIYEAQYNAETAQKLVYHSWWMKGTLIFMALNLIVSVLHRYPWKKKHIGFMTVHAGILVLMFGSILTSRYGVDGSLYLEINSSNRWVSMSDYEFSIWLADANSRATPFLVQPVDFLVEPPNIDVKVGEDRIQVTDFVPYAYARTQVEPAEGKEDPSVMPAVRVQLFNDRINMTEWMQPTKTRPDIKALGPANMVFANGAYEPTKNANELVLKTLNNNKETLSYEVYSKSKNGLIKKGKIKAGETIETGWMNIQLRLLSYYPKAKIEQTFEALKHPTPLTTSAVAIDYNGEKHWLGLNGVLKLFKENAVYFITYANRRLDLGFNIDLDHFEVGRYQGTVRAASYKSLVNVEGLGQREISMNEPLKYKGYTFYQASFQEDPNTGQPTASILSVNKDPGRWWKYLGALMIVIGAMLMFYLGDYLKKSSGGAKS